MDSHEPWGAPSFNSKILPAVVSRLSCANLSGACGRFGSSAAIFRGEIQREDRDIWDETYLNFCIKCVEKNVILGFFRRGIFRNGAAAMRGYSAQFFDLSPLTVFDRPVLELGRFAVDPLQGNLREISMFFVWPGVLSRSW